MTKTIKAIGLLSGGLDSTLAVKMIIDQGIDVTVLNFVTPFCTCTRKGCRHEASRVAKLFGVPVKIISARREYIEMIKNPKHGYGRNMNPCIDCRILIFKSAKKYMEEIGAKFIFTGEVLGQRPMSQYKKAMKIIERESNLENLVVRPLSAKLLESTIPEEKNWVDREKLLSIQGRRRLPQMELADKLGIKDYPCPAGGCRLTDPQFAKRLKESFEHGEDAIKDIQLLKYGRHFRLKGGAKVVVGRDEEENKILLRFFDEDDILIEVIGVGSPIALLKKSKDEEDINKAASFCVRYSDVKEGEDAEIRVKYSINRAELVTLSQYKRQSIDDMYEKS
jgi:tRNA U34 2-thiouridine synthase MnmA/TrmU